MRFVNWATYGTRHVGCQLGVLGVGGDGGPATSATCGSPAGVLADGAGGVYFSDFATSSVRHVLPDGSIVPFLGVETYNTDALYSGDGGPATLATINGPAHLASDCASDVFVANRLNHNILRVSGGIVRSIAGSVGSLSGYSGDGGPASLARLNSPNGVAYDCVTGFLYIADTFNSVVRVVSANREFKVHPFDFVSTRKHHKHAVIISTFAGTGSPGFGGDAGPATLASLNQPRGVSVDGTGGLYIADTANGCSEFWFCVALSGLYVMLSPCV